MNFESSISARQGAELQQAEEEAWFVYLLAEADVHRAEASYRRALTKFLKADERFLEVVTAALSTPTAPGSVEAVAKLMDGRQRSAAAVDAKRPAWIDAVRRWEEADAAWKAARERMCGESSREPLTRPFVRSAPEAPGSKCRDALRPDMSVSTRSAAEVKRGPEQPGGPLGPRIARTGP